MIKNMWDFASKCNVKVCVAIYDEESNVMQEMSSSSEFTTDFVVRHKQKNKHLKLDEYD